MPRGSPYARVSRWRAYAEHLACRRSSGRRALVWGNGEGRSLGALIVARAPVGILGVCSAAIDGPLEALSISPRGSVGAGKVQPAATVAQASTRTHTSQARSRPSVRSPLRSHHAPACQRQFLPTLRVGRRSRPRPAAPATGARTVGPSRARVPVDRTTARDRGAFSRHCP